MRPAVARPTLLRPGSASMPQLPTRPLPVQIKTAATHLMPPPGVLNPVQRDKKTGGAYSAAGDDDINDVAAMGGVNLAEEANVSLYFLAENVHVKTVIFYTENTGSHRPCRVHHQICQGRVFPSNWSPQSEGRQDLQGKGRTEMAGLVDSSLYCDLLQGLESPSAEVLNLISHATQERLKNLVSKLSVVAEHRLDVIKTEGKLNI